jgi:hypothetical protein
MQSILFVDFDNVFLLDKSRAQEWLSSSLNALMRQVLSLEAACDFLEIRLYGGWRDIDGLQTNAASNIRRVLGTEPMFPFRLSDGRIIRGSIDLAESLLSLPSVVFSGTVKRRTGLPRFQLAEHTIPIGCVAEQTCPLVQIKRMTKRANPKCFEPSCPVACSDAFKVVEQKLVDVMMACDILQAQAITPNASIFVLSNDVDLIPSIIAAGSMGAHVTVLYGSSWEHPYDIELKRAGIDIHRTLEDML